MSCPWGFLICFEQPEGETLGKTKNKISQTEAGYQKNMQDKLHVIVDLQ